MRYAVVCPKHQNGHIFDSELDALEAAVDIRKASGCKVIVVALTENDDAHLSTIDPKRGYL